MAKYDTAKNIINAAGIECGLTTVNASPYSSTDPAYIQLVQLLTTGGREMVNMYAWQHLINTFSMVTGVADTGDYPLPTDFMEMIDQSGWSSTYRTPLGGPLDSQDWQMVVNNNTLASIYVSFRIFKDQFSLWPRPPVAGVNVNYEYRSRYWVGTVSATVPVLTLTKDAPTVSADVVLFDSLLITKFLKIKFLSARGMDHSDADDEFVTIFNQITGANNGAAVLSLTRKTLFPYIGDRNVPTTRFGL